MLMELKVNGHASRIASVAELRQKLVPFASQQFREIWLSIDSGGPILGTLMNTKFGCLLYLRPIRATSALLRATRCTTNPTR